MKQILVLIFLASLLKGLFTNEAFYSWFSLLIILFIYFAVRNNPLSLNKKVNLLFLSQLFIASIELFVGINKEASLHGLFRSLAPILTFFLVLNYCNRQEKCENNILFTIFLSGITVSILNFATFLSSQDIKSVRFSTVIEYANTLAIFLLVCILIGIYLYENASKSKKIFILSGILINFAALVLTYSRLVIIITVVAVPLYLVLTKRKTYLLKIIAGTFFVLLLASTQFIDRFSKIFSGATELLERFAYYNDAIAIIKDYFLFGLGPGGWNSLQYQYQTAVYSVQYVHSSLLQVFIDYGIIGFLNFMFQIFLLVYFSQKAITKARDKNLIWTIIFINSSILLHSFLDIDFDFPFIGVIYWTFIAILCFESSEKYVVSKKISILAVASIALVISTMLSVSSIYYARGESLAKAGNLEDSIACLKKTTAIVPNSSSSYFLLGQIYKKNFIENHLESDKKLSLEYLTLAKRYDSKNPLYSAALMDLFKEAKDRRSCISEYQNLIDIQPMLIDHYEGLSTSMLEQGIEDFNNKQYDSAKANFESIIQLEKKINGVKLKISPLAYILQHKPSIDITPILSDNINSAKKYNDKE